MRQLLLACALLAMAGAAGAQPYVPTPNISYPGVAPGTVAPGPPSDYASPSYIWREDRGEGRRTLFGLPNSYNPARMIALRGL
jgi:hypothetical protein